MTPPSLRRRHELREGDSNALPATATVFDQPLSVVLLFGMPGTGKGTQGKLLGEIPGIFHLSTGEIFRALSDETEEGRLVAEHIRAGELVPDDLTIEIWRHWLEAQIEAQNYRPHEQILLLDGIPRRVRQCELLQPYIQVLQILFLNCRDESVLIQRLRQRALQEGRADDADETVIRHRFEVYRQETAPILDFYPQELIREIDPIGSTGEVLKRILAHLLPLTLAHRNAAPTKPTI
jgi:adenylate kinase